MIKKQKNYTKINKKLENSRENSGKNQRKIYIHSMKIKIFPNFF